MVVHLDPILVQFVYVTIIGKVQGHRKKCAFLAENERVKLDEPDQAAWRKKANMNWTLETVK